VSGFFLKRLLLVVKSSGFKAYKVQGSGFRVQGSGFKVVHGLKVQG
jgi:hypothetical protein